jgi:hypothetical protein
MLLLLLLLLLQRRRQRQRRLPKDRRINSYRLLHAVRAL